MGSMRGIWRFGGPALAGLAWALLPGCASETPPAKAPPPAPPPVAPRAQLPAGMKVSSELGQLDERATDAAFQKAQGGLAQCFSEGLSRVEYLSGEVAMFVRIGENGSAKVARFSSSTLGDRTTETCMISVLLRTSWPRPMGGEGEARKTLTFDPPSDVRPPSLWPADRVASLLATHRSKLKGCQADQGNGRFSVTAYVTPDGHHTGKILSAGGASKAAEDDAKLECVLDAVKDWKLPSPGSYAAKVTFSL